ncbi:ras guanine nucleotide exchange factor domain-containing protein [Pisolithus orientalis]|uniref:ras guanine nucleotide exchange factor domain-containing protein n=1 Tax=Pisolithus orientalis TaxID=936130 RepID=UPI0022256F2D|nr:ras guanine nucleotide exchange factor domain-containing protein [Pisolithus orientalis]KAI6030536.1 ras guanine nucleotide exchange factor domain-containing protein [Pisolithus orientalis]
MSEYSYSYMPRPMAALFEEPKPPAPKALSAGSGEAVSPITKSSIPLHFNLKKSFPAITTTISLLQKVPETKDLDALRALVPVFVNCLNSILDSMDKLPKEVCTGYNYLHAKSTVAFFRAMLEGHIKEVTDANVQSDSKRTEIIDKTMQFLDGCMSATKDFFQVAAQELIQLKPLPRPPSGAELEDLEESTEEASDSPVSSCAEDKPSVPEQQTQSEKPPPERIAADEQPQKAQKPKFSLLRPLSIRRKKKNVPPEGSSGSSTLVDSDPIQLKGDYIHVSTTIRSSIVQFPDFIKEPIPNTLPHVEDATEIWKDRNGLVELATLRALVRYMTSTASRGDVEITDIFFLCFRFFSTPTEVFSAFIERYDEKPPKGLPPAEASTVSLYAKMRIAKLLFLWVELHWRPEEDGDVFNPLMQFAFTRLSKDLLKEASSKLVTALHDRACAGEKGRGMRVERTVAHAESKIRSESLVCKWEPKDKKAMVRGDFAKVNLLSFNVPGGHSLLALQLTLFLWEKYRVFEPEDAVRYLMVRKGDSTEPTTEVARQVANFMSYEKRLHRWVMDSLASAQTTEARTELIEMFLDVAQHCHDMRNYSASCLISLACDRPSVLPFLSGIKISSKHEKIKAMLSEFYTGGNNHFRAYKDALQNCHCAALPGMMLFIGEVARGCGSGPYEAHPLVPGSRLINLRRYRPITWAVRAMERCHVPFKIQRVDYVCDWFEHVLAPYREGTEMEWENRIHAKCRKM